MAVIFGNSFDDCPINSMERTALQVWPTAQPGKSPPERRRSVTPEKSYPQLNGTGAVDSFIWKKRIGGPLWQSSNAMIETAKHLHLDNGHFRFRTMQMGFSMHVW
ncbi:hypothetical protein ABC425_15395 [Brucella melitensis]|uniref:hypothetical protein n=1 Tax=Brucella melitensis TaxID=29459 RepID=UPI0031FCFD40